MSAGSGYVKEVGAGVKVAAVGDPVLCSFSYCGACEICKAGHFSHCNDLVGQNFAGPYKAFKSGESEVSGLFFGQSSFANYSIVKEASVVNAKGLVKDKKELQLFAPLGCGIQTGSGTVINTAQATPEDIICITGLGGVGLSAVMAAKISGCRIIIGVDRIESRLALAEEMGCTHVINGSKLPENTTLTDAIKKIADGTGANIVIDTTGAPPLIEAGLDVTRNRGKYIQVGSPPPDYTLSKVNVFEFMCSGKQFIGAIEGQAFPPEYVPKMIKWRSEGRFPIDKMAKFFPADDFKQALHEMHTGETIKPILTWS